ncbi:hypothetical protein CU098_013542, partial [Rhizopus stolonifer]
EESNEEHPSFWKDWIRFLENSQNFHPYSPEYHNIIRCGENVSPRPNLDDKIYNEHIKHHEVKSYKVPELYIPYLNGIFKSKNRHEYKNAIRDIPLCNSDETAVFDFLEAIFRATYNFHTTNVDIKDGETAFNSIFIYPFLEAEATFLADSVNWSKAGFRR